MPLLLLERTDETIARVEMIHYQPWLLSKETADAGINITEVPQPENQTGKNAVLVYNKETKNVYYEYVDRPLTTEEELALVKQKNIELEASLLEMSMLAANQEQRNTQNEQAIMELTTIIAGGNA